MYSSSDARLLLQRTYDVYPDDLSPDLEFEDVSQLTTDLVHGLTVTRKARPKAGLMTHERLAIVDKDGIQGYRERAYYYDYRGRTIQVVDLDGKLRTTDRYDLLGNLLSRRESYTQNGQTDIVDRTYTYDSRSRMTKETAQLNGRKGELAVVNYSYNDLGQLIGKTYGTGSYAIHEKIAYNLQGWTTSKSSEMFDLYLSYDAPSQKMAAPSYTGNISESLWRHKCLNGNPDSQTADYRYDYTYDDLSRLKSAESYYNSRNNLLEKYCERISYDKNGNIVTLNRPGTTSAESQNYIFTYSGNQRTGETNSGSAYAYDANGNMHCDALTGFYIHHNFLNLPDAICTESN